MAFQTSVTDPPVAVAGMVSDLGSNGEIDSGIAYEDLEPGQLLAWQDAAAKTVKKFTGSAGEVFAGVVKYSSVVPQSYPTASASATFPAGAQLEIVRAGRVWALFAGATAAVAGDALYVVATGTTKGQATMVTASNNPAPIIAKTASASGLVKAEINLSTGNAKKA